MPQLCLGPIIQTAQVGERRREVSTPATWEASSRLLRKTVSLLGTPSLAPGKPLGERAPCVSGARASRMQPVLHHNSEVQSALKAQDLLRLIWLPNPIALCVLLQNINVFNYRILPQALLWVLCNIHELCIPFLRS